MSKKQGNKPTKSYAAVRAGINIKASALECVEHIAIAEGIARDMVSSIALSMIDASTAPVRTGELAAVDDLAHFYGEARIAAGVQASTVGKEQSILRNICRACFGGAANVKRLREQAEVLKLSDLAAFAKTITKKAHLNPRAHTSAKAKTKAGVTDKEFANIKRLSEFLTVAQAQRIIALCEQRIASVTKPAKVVKLKKAA